jgi:hypothetical protein
METKGPSRFFKSLCESANSWLEKKFPEQYQDCQQVCSLWIRTIGTSIRLVRLTVRSVLFTSLMLMRMFFRITRWLTPITRPIGPESRYRKRATGLPIPAMEVTLFVFGGAVLVAHAW